MTFGAISRKVFAKSSLASATALKNLPCDGKGNHFCLTAAGRHFDAIASKIVVSQQTEIGSRGKGLYQALVAPYLGDLIKVDQRLDSFALEIVVSKPAAVWQPVIRVEPIIQQDAGGIADPLISPFAPRFDLFADAGHQRRGGDARLQEGELIAVLLALAGHRYVTLAFTVLVVSLPRMSMTFRTIMYSPGSV